MNKPHACGRSVCLALDGAALPCHRTPAMMMCVPYGGTFGCMPALCRSTAPRTDHCKGVANGRGRSHINAKDLEVRRDLQQGSVRESTALGGTHLPIRPVRVPLVRPVVAPLHQHAASGRHLGHWNARTCWVVRRELHPRFTKYGTMCKLSRRRPSIWLLHCRCVIRSA